MKHSKLFVSLICVAFMVAGCDNSGKNKTAKGDDGLNYSSESIVDKETFQTNYDVEVDEDDPDPGYKMLLNDKEFTNKNLLATYGSTILEVTNEQGYIGFFSKIHNDYIIAPYLVPNTFTVNHYNVSRIGSILELHYEGQYFVYDAMGNLLETNDEPISNVPSTEYVNELTYLKFKVDSSEDHVYEYSANGKARLVDRVPEEIIIPDLEEYEGPKLNDLFTYGAVELDYYGLPGYKLMENGQGYVTAFDGGDRAVSSFYIGNAGVNLIGIVDQSLYYQIITQLSERIENYSFSVGNNKYYLESYRVNIGNGEKEALAINAVFDAIQPIKDSNKNVSMYLAFYRSINVVKTLGQQQQRVVDKEFVFHDDMSGIAFLDLRRISANRYLDGNGVLYDETLKPITFLTEMQNRHVYLHQKVIEGTVDGKVGLVDFDGKVVVEFRYDQIYTWLGENDKYIARMDDKVFRITARSTNQEYLGTQFTIIQNNLYRTYSSGHQEYRYFTTSRNLFTLDSTLVPTINTYSYLGKTFFSVTYNELDENSVYHYHFFMGSMDTFTPQSIPESVKGKACLDTMYKGDTKEHALPIGLGINNVHLINNINARWIKIDPIKGENIGLFLTEYQFANTIYRQKVGSTEMSYSALVPHDVSFTAGMHLYEKYFEISGLGEELYSYYFYLSDIENPQITQVVVDYCQGIEQSNAVDGGVVGINNFAFHAPKYLEDVGEFYVSLRSLNSVDYTINLTSNKGAVTLNRLHRLGYSSNLLEDGKARIAANSDSEVFVFETVNAIPQDAAITVTTTETTSTDYKAGQLFHNASVLALAEAKEIEMDKNDNNGGFGFMRFTPNNGGQYKISGTYSSSVIQNKVLVFNAKGEILIEYTTSAVSAVDETVKIEDGGYAMVRYQLSTSSVTANFNVSSIINSTDESPYEVTAEINDQMTVNVYQGIKEYKYYKIAVEDERTLSVLSDQDSNVKTYYRTSDTTYVPFVHNLQMSGTSTDPVTYFIKVEVSKTAKIFLSTKVGTQEIVSKLSMNDTLVGSDLAVGSARYIIVENDKERDIHITLTVTVSVSIFFSTSGFVTCDTKDTNMEHYMHLGANEKLYVSIVNTNTLNLGNYRLSVYESSHAFDVSNEKPNDSALGNYNWDLNDGVYSVDNYAYNKVSEMYIDVVRAGKLCFWVNLGSHGTFTVFTRSYNFYTGIYGSRLQYSQKSSETGEFVLVTVNVTEGMRVIFKYVEGLDDRTDLTVQVKDFSFEPSFVY